MLLARSSARQREVALRAALGASRGRTIRQLLTESLVLAAAGGIAGAALGAWGLRLLLALAPEGIPRLAEVSLDPRIFLATFAVALLSGAAFGIAPALEASAVHLQPALKEGGSAGAGREGGRLRRAFVAAEIAIAIVLLVGAGLMIRTFLALRAIDPGWNPDGRRHARGLARRHVARRPGAARARLPPAPRAHPRGARSRGRGRDQPPADRRRHLAIPLCGRGAARSAARRVAGHGLPRGDSRLLRGDASADRARPRHRRDRRRERSRRRRHQRTVRRDPVAGRGRARKADHARRQELADGRRHRQERRALRLERAPLRGVLHPGLPEPGAHALGPHVGVLPDLRRAGRTRSKESGPTATRRPSRPRSRRRSARSTRRCRSRACARCGTW